MRLSRIGSVLEEYWIWAKPVFAGATISGHIHHLIEEANELLEAYEDKTIEDMESELADCYFILYYITKCLRIDPSAACLKKLEELKKREWLPPDENGVIRRKKV